MVDMTNANREDKNPVGSATINFKWEKKGSN